MGLLGLNEIEVQEIINMNFQKIDEQMKMMFKQEQEDFTKLSNAILSINKNSGNSEEILSLKIEISNLHENQIKLKSYTEKLHALVTEINEEKMSLEKQLKNMKTELKEIPTEVKKEKVKEIEVDEGYCMGCDAIREFDNITTTEHEGQIYKKGTCKECKGVIYRKT